MRELFSDSNGNLSMMRVLSALIVVNVMCVWTVTCICSGEMVDFSLTAIGLITSALGCKTIQKTLEK